MIATAKPTPRRKSAPAWHKPFMAMLPAIVRHARIAFRDYDPEQREDLVEETIANCLLAYVRLVELGKADLGYAGVLARYAVAQIHAGRKVGTPLRSKDVLSRYAQQRRGIQVERLDRFVDEEKAWLELVVESKHATPADVAATRIDFAAWLDGLSGKVRKMAEVLATGENTRDAAKRFGVTDGRISHVRRELMRSWEMFQHERYCRVAAA